MSLDILIGYGVLSRRLCYICCVDATWFLFGLGYLVAFGVSVGLCFFCVFIVTLSLFFVGVMVLFPNTFSDANADLPRFSEDMPLNIISKD